MKKVGNDSNLLLITVISIIIVIIKITIRNSKYHKLNGSRNPKILFLWFVIESSKNDDDKNFTIVFNDNL